jgi:hypothetical protein
VVMFISALILYICVYDFFFVPLHDKVV